MKKYNPHKGHRQRMRDRVIEAGGLKDFENHEVLEMMLYYSVKQADTNALAHRMIDRFGSFENLMSASYEEIKEICNVSHSTAFLIYFMAEVAKRYVNGSKEEACYVRSKTDALNTVLNMLRDEERERFFVIGMDVNYKLVKVAQVAIGGVGNVEVSIKGIISALISSSCRYAVVAHNHPGETFWPSCSDEISTKTLKNALDTVGIELIDHLIICRDKAYSFAQSKNCDLNY